MRLFAALGVCLAVSACGDAMTYPAQINNQAGKAEATTASTPVNAVVVTKANTINGGAFAVVGDVKATVGKVTAFHADPTVAQAEQKLRVEAAELGADAVINAEISDVTICALSWGCRKVSGTAVNLK